MVESYGKTGNTESLRQRIFALLDENPSLTATTICQLLELPYEQNYRYLNKLKNEWKSNRENEQGSKCSSVHGWRGSCCVPFFVSRDLAVEAGWTKYDEATFNGVNMHFYRRPKRFGSLKTMDNKSIVGTISNYNS